MKHIFVIASMFFFISACLYFFQGNELWFSRACLAIGLNIADDIIELLKEISKKLDK